MLKSYRLSQYSTETEALRIEKKGEYLDQSSVGGMSREEILLHFYNTVCYA